VISRERRCELLAMAPSTELIALAERLLAADEIAEALIVTHHPETGAVVMQVREPVCAERFHLGDVVVTRAEVAIDGQRGWSMRLGSDRPATLAAAMCDALAVTSRHSWQSWRDEIDALCRQTAEHHEELERREWSELVATAVAFEELD
jgi:alpha-D-ribose 1-methylphosphonate 5-triphosphate synthase subunit PhnG